MRLTRKLLMAGLLAAFSACAEHPPVPTEKLGPVVKITANRFHFTPDRITLVRGRPVTLELTSTDVAHGFMIRALKIDTDVKPGKLTDITVTPGHSRNVQGDLRPLLRLWPRRHAHDSRRGRAARQLRFGEGTPRLPTRVTLRGGACIGGLLREGEVVRQTVSPRRRDVTGVYRWLADLHNAHEDRDRGCNCDQDREASARLTRHRAAERAIQTHGAEHARHQ